MATLPPKHVMDLLLDAICVVDRQGRFLTIAGACESIFGYQPEEMLGKPMIDFVHPEDRVRTPPRQNSCRPDRNLNLS